MRTFFTYTFPKWQKTCQFKQIRNNFYINPSCNLSKNWVIVSSSSRESGGAFTRLGEVYSLEPVYSPKPLSMFATLIARFVCLITTENIKSARAVYFVNYRSENLKRTVTLSFVTYFVNRWLYSLDEKEWAGGKFLIRRVVL